MKVVLPRKELLKGVQTVQSVVAVKNTMPILSNVLLETKEKALEFTATDLDIGIRCRVPAEIVGKGSLTVNAKKLSDIVRELPESRVDLETDENHRLILSCEKSLFKIHGLPKDDFPLLPDVKKEKKMSLSGKMLVEMIRKTIFSASTDETRMILNGGFLVCMEDKIRLVSTDGHRLAMVEKKNGKADVSKSTMILPTKALQEILRILGEEIKKKDEEEDVNVEIIASENQAYFSIGEIEMITRLLEGQYPNYEQVIPKEKGKRVEGKVEKLSSATRRVSLLSSDRSFSVKYKLSKNKLVVQTSTADIGEAKEEVEVRYDGEEIQIAFNAHYLLDVYKHIDEEEVLMDLTQPLSPVLLRPKENKEVLYVVMPMRV